LSPARALSTEHLDDRPRSSLEPDSKLRRSGITELRELRCVLRP
jgi:hypothetical protein